jgi:peptidoglycan hydrolase-like protein with peptidoglycan-binding domain
MENTNLKKMVETEMKKRGLLEQEMMDQSSPFVEMISKLRFSIEQTQVYHWQSQSLSEHLALNEYYDGIPDIVDGIVESYQGKYGIQKGYKLFEVRDYSTPEEVINFLKKLDEDIESLRQSVKESYIQNQIDTAVEQIQTTIYKLENLK